MKKKYGFPATVLLLSLAAGCTPSQPAAAGWKEALEQRIPLYGHRNWIVIADSAYPAQASEGIETVVASADQLDVLKHVLAMLSASKHVKPIVYTDNELNFIEDKDAPGIVDYRKQLANLLHNEKPSVLPHEQIISKLDQSSRIFRTLIIKTNMAIAYTSVFLQLDCAYWNADAERKLRNTIAEHRTGL